jgi:hypothetical protein
MKPFSTLSRTLAFLLALALLVGAVGPAAAQTPITITADENGHGSFNSSGASGPIPTSVGTDPGPGGRPNALFYGLTTGGVGARDGR